jgi:hypothetical protein
LRKAAKVSKETRIRLGAPSLLLCHAERSEASGFLNSFDQDGKAKSRFFVAALLRMTDKTRMEFWATNAARKEPSGGKFARAAKTFNDSSAKGA